MLVKWLIFNIFLFSALAFDLYSFKKNPKRLTQNGALKWSGIWLGLGIAYGVLTGFIFSQDHMMAYFSGYLIEKSLSIDNLFVFITIFSSYHISLKYQHRVLFWGIFGALVMRAFFIFFGLFFIEKFDWVFYIMGIFLAYTAIKLFMERHTRETFTQDSRFYYFIKTYMNVDFKHKGPKFFIRKNGKKFATALFASLVMIELMDVIFAADSVPAIFAITQDPYIVYTANAFAILGLRSMFFVVSKLLSGFYYLRHGLSLIILFVAIKMLTHKLFEIPVFLSLGFILTVLLGAYLFSCFREKAD